jgi:hypothetical protein
MAWGYGYCGACCTITVSVTGTVKGCNSTGVVGVAIVLTDHATGSPLGTVTTSTGGALSGATFAGTNGQQVDVTITFARWVTFTTTKTVSGGVLALGTITPTVASGYTCISSCNLPIANTLTWTTGASCGGAGFAGLAYASCTLVKGTVPGNALAGDFWYATVNNTISGFAGGLCTGGTTVTFPYFFWSPQNGFGVTDPGQLASCKEWIVNSSGPASQVCPTISGTVFSRVYDCIHNVLAGTLSE